MPRISPLRASAPIPAYAPVKEQLFATFAAGSMGAPLATADAVFQVVDAAEPPPLRLLGATTVAMLHQVYEQRLAVWDQWAPVSAAAQGTRTDLRLPEAFFRPAS